MKFKEPLKEGLFLKRYKRFFADIQWEDQVITAHVPNTGSMKGCLAAGAPCRFTTHDDPKRKLKYTLQMIRIGETWIGVNTGLSNQVVWEAFESKSIPHWRKFQWGKREVKINDSSRVDFAFWGRETSHKPHDKIDPSWLKGTDYGLFHFVEVKNVTLAGEKGAAQFPDAVTTRGQKHLRDLIILVEAGHSAEILFTIQRLDCNHFCPADEIDPEYGRLLREAKRAGVIISPYLCDLNPQGVTMRGREKLRLKINAP